MTKDYSLPQLSRLLGLHYGQLGKRSHGGVKVREHFPHVPGDHRDTMAVAYAGDKRTEHILDMGLGMLAFLTRCFLLSP